MQLRILLHYVGFLLRLTKLNVSIGNQLSSEYR